MDIADLRATRIASESLTNDVNNLRRAVGKANMADVPEESKVWQFAVTRAGRSSSIDAPPAPRR